MEKKSKTKVYKDLMTERQGEKKAFAVAAVVCSAITMVPVAGLVGTCIKVDSAFLNALRKNEIFLIGSAIGTGVTAVTLNIIRETIKDRNELLKTINGDYIENPATSTKIAATYEIEKRKEQNKAYKKDEITSAVLFGLSILGIVLSNAKGEDTSYFEKIIKEIGPKPFTGAAVVSALSGLASLLRSWAGNNREKHLIRQAFDVEGAIVYRAESGDRSDETTKGYARILEERAKKKKLPETPAGE